MKWNIYAETEAFSEKVEPLLYGHEDIYSLFLGILNHIKQGKYEDYFLALAEDEGVVLAACLMTPPHPLQLVCFQGVPELESELSRLLLESGIEVKGIVGDRETVNRFVLAWIAETGQKANLLMDQGLYRADAVATGLEKSPGTWRVANKKDAPLLEEWCLLFEVETGIKVSSPAEAARKIDAFIEGKEVYVWEVDGEVVSCMKKTRPSKRGITVSFVFTPRKHRRKGYARTLVAEVTEELLLEYDFAMLYTDLKNPTSNKIYQEIGYEQIANPVHVSFEE
ncbi:GNAT family N-acetyltransferase [Planomicrobium sp. CPCC 101079]|uniref:GNAT family N-acetyltransferase n=1 Tax=Planomicrobium sp. CPCC 101079 TaxID=2599618 RepID=UPI0011B84A5D|nr:GNAT family N-acetyltransferase [Planomicrobium sp. CPCC 101079]TWT02271.1 GNAT family N-acetyltransferase [Planomicrobium sp. CPCC 101079]